MPGGAAREDPRVKARSILLAVLSAEVAVLTVTGIALFFVYRPSDAEAWTEVRVGAGEEVLSDWVRLAHRLAAGCSVPTALVAGGLVALNTWSPRRRLGPLLGVGMVLATVAAWRTGFRLPWDQLALWAVTVGKNLDGYEVLFGDSVRFVILDGERSPTSIIWWLGIHAALAGPVLGLLLAFAWRDHVAARAAAPDASAAVR